MGEKFHRCGCGGIMYGQRPKGAIGAQTDFRKNSGVPADGTVGLGATQGSVGFRGSTVGADEKTTVPISERERPSSQFVWYDAETPFQQKYPQLLLSPQSSTLRGPRKIVATRRSDEAGGLRETTNKMMYEVISEL